jgi:molecular chaperone GrpE
LPDKWQNAMNTEEIINEPNENIQNQDPNMEKSEDTIDKTEELSEKTTEIVEKTPEEKYDTLYDDYLRLYSEFDNFRKRNVKERMELIKTAGNDVIKSILPAIDDLERAVKTFETSDKESLQQGIQLIHHKLKTILGDKGLVEMNPVGEKFDADQHEAITQLPAPSDKEKGLILDVIEKGYKLNEVIIRYPKVIVYI